MRCPGCMDAGSDRGPGNMRCAVLTYAMVLRDVRLPGSSFSQPSALTIRCFASSRYWPTVWCYAMLGTGLE
eukprot:2746154-Rhodomonas_salina.1